MPPVTAERKYALGLLAVMILAAILRLHDLGLRSLWLDETFSAWFSAQDWRTLWNVVPTYETHPPFYYSLLKLWRVFGADEFTLRLFSVVVSLLTIPLIYLCGKICGGGRVGLLAAFMFACAKLEIFYAQDARPYACFTLAMAIMTTAACWLVRYPERAKLPPRLLVRDPAALLAYAAFAVGLALLQWFQNVGFIFIAPAGLFLIVWWAKSNRCDRYLFLNLAVATVVAVLLYAPFIPDFLHQATAFKGGFWLTAPTMTYLATQTLHLFGQTFDGRGAPLRVLIFVVTILPVAAAGLYYLFHKAKADDERAPLALLLFSASAGAWIFNIALTYILQPVFMERTLLPLQMPWFVLLAMAAFALPSRLQRPGILVLCTMFLAGAIEYVMVPEAAPNGVQRPWNAIVLTVATTAPQAPVLAMPNHAAMAMSYYEAKHHMRLDIRPLPAPFPAVDEKYTYSIGGRGVPDVTAQDVDRAIDALGDAPQFWLVTHGATLDPRDAAPTEADKEFQRVLNHRYRGKRVYQDRGATLILFTKT